MSLLSRLEAMATIIGEDVGSLESTRARKPVDVAAIGNVDVMSADTAQFDSPATWFSGRVLLHEQTNTFENGVWLFYGNGAPMERSAADLTFKVGQTIFVRSGTMYGGHLFVSTKNSVVGEDRFFEPIVSGSGGSGEPGPAGPSGVYIGPDPPEDTSLLWVDSDELSSGTGGIDVGMGVVPSYSHEERPDAFDMSAKFAYISDLPLIDRLQFSDGVNWYSVATSRIVGNFLGDTPLNYFSNGDENGLVYWLGTDGKTVPFSNPVPSKLALTGSDPEHPTYPYVNATNRLADTAASQDIPGQKLAWDLGPNRLMNFSHITIQGRDVQFNHLRNYVVEASQDGGTWINLFTAVDDTTINAGTWKVIEVSSSLDYRYIRIRMTGPESSGSNFLTLGEIEFYGLLREVA